MSTYRKEKNLIYITLDGKSGSYKLDINTGVFYGIKGNPIKSCPCSAIRGLFPYQRRQNATNLEYMLYTMFSRTTNTAYYVEAAKALQSADKLDALKIPCLSAYDEDYIYLGDNIKALSAYIKDNGTDNLSARAFRSWVEFEEAKKELGSVADLLTPEMYHALKAWNFSKKEMEACAYYLGRGKLWEYHRGNISVLSDYINFCRYMQKEPQKVNNFMREFCETKKEYELRKAEYDNRRMAENYAKHSKAWEFSYGNHTIIVPKTAQDIIDEGARMHHCVGSYVNCVLDNSTYIVFVRHKDTPDNCYITCQVHTNGNIGQYFLAYDRYINSDEDRAFYDAFQKHLTEVWKNN
jgi:hypothetical protein